MKKNGILHRISTAVLAGAMLLSLASCGASSSQTASSAAGKVTGTGSAKGIEGDVVVEVTADADTIYSIVVTEQNETQGIGSVACEQLPDAMVAANSYNVDGIAGATVTSDALKEAVKAALENAGLDASAFAVAKAADTTVEKTAETLDCDVVVVGAGGAGLTAAAQAAENSAKVIVVEKMPIVGGNSLKATGGMNAADTQYQADLGITDSGVQEFIEDTINAKSVIIAAGGFGANFELMASFNPALANAVTTNHAGATGDGILMAEAIGADTVDMDQIQLHPTVYQETGMLVSESVRSMGGILVNAEGKRFCNDMSTRDAVSNAELEQPGAYAYIIFDQRIVDDLKSCQKYISNGLTVSSDSYEGLAKEMGLTGDAAANFVETMNTWNASVAAGEDAEFGRNNGMDGDLSTAPYYAIKIAPGIHHTMGGLKINTDAQVLDTDGSIIPGLYAAGETTGGVHGGNRIGGNAVCDFVVFGRIAGSNASAYAAE